MTNGKELAELQEVSESETGNLGKVGDAKYGLQIACYK